MYIIFFVLRFYHSSKFSGTQVRASWRDCIAAMSTREVQGSSGKLDRFAIWKTDWWFGTWILWLSIQLGMSSSQLLPKLHHFSEGLKYHEPENHKRKLSIRGPVSIAVIPMWNYQRVDAKNVPSSVDILRFWHSVFNSWVSAQWWFPVRPLYV